MIHTYKESSKLILNADEVSHLIKLNKEKNNVHSMVISQPSIVREEHWERVGI